MRQTSVTGNESFNGNLNMQRTFVDLNQYMSVFMVLFPHHFLYNLKINPDRYYEETKQTSFVRFHFQNRKYPIVVFNCVGKSKSYTWQRKSFFLFCQKIDCANLTMFMHFQSDFSRFHENIFQLAHYRCMTNNIWSKFNSNKAKKHRHLLNFNSVSL